MVSQLGQTHRWGPATRGDRTRSGLLSLLALVVATSALVVTVVWRFALHTSPTSPHYTYGGLPSWLPKSSEATNRVLSASIAHPQLGIEGDVVRITLPTGSTVATMTGPQVPPFVTPPPPYTTATITLSFSHTTGVVALRARDFAILDGNGKRYAPRTFVGGDSSLSLRDGAKVSVRLREYLAIGSGSIRWAPQGRPVTTWDFTVEND